MSTLNHYALRMAVLNQPSSPFVTHGNVHHRQVNKIAIQSHSVALQFNCRSEDHLVLQR
jgi:hypothetical protein